MFDDNLNVLYILNLHFFFNHEILYYHKNQINKNYLLYFRYEHDGTQKEEDTQQSHIIKSTFSDGQNNNKGLQFTQDRKGQLSLPLSNDYWSTEGKQ